MERGQRPGRRYQTPTGIEGEQQPGSAEGILRNLLGITRQVELDQAEYRAYRVAQQRYVRQITAETQFTAALICEMHRDWLGDIYEWAGRYRTVELAKDDMRWPPAIRVADNMIAFESELLRKHTPCRPGPLGEVAHRIAEVHAEFLLIHPFRDGNGRVARWLAGLMALQAGLPLPEYRFAGSGSDDECQHYLRAVKRGYCQDYDRLTEFFAEAISRRLTESTNLPPVRRRLRTRER